MFRPTPFPPNCCPVTSPSATSCHPAVGASFSSSVGVLKFVTFFMNLFATFSRSSSPPFAQLLDSCCRAKIPKIAVPRSPNPIPHPCHTREVENGQPLVKGPYLSHRIWLPCGEGPSSEAERCPCAGPFQTPYTLGSSRGRSSPAPGSSCFFPLYYTRRSIASMYSCGAEFEVFQIPVDSFYLRHG